MRFLVLWEVLVTTIILPPEIEKTLVEEAEKRGTTPELLAVDCLRDVSFPRQRCSHQERPEHFLIFSLDI